MGKVCADTQGAGLEYSAYSSKLWCWNGTFAGALEYGTLSAYSDERLKSDIQPITSALDTVTQIQGITYTKDGNPTAGVTAQQLETVLPNLVKTNDPDGDCHKCPKDADGNEIHDYKTVEYVPLIAYLIEAVNLANHGVNIEHTDKLLRKFGMPMGPFRLIDEVGGDVCQHVADDLLNRLETKFPNSNLLRRMIEDEDIMIPCAMLLDELRNFIVTESGKAEASTGHYDDMVMSLAIACEVYRTHGHALTNKSFSWGETNTLFEQQDTKWL